MLQNAGVEVMVDLGGVGNNVQEHYFMGVAYRASNFVLLCDFDAKDFKQR